MPRAATTIDHEHALHAAYAQQCQITDDQAVGIQLNVPNVVDDRPELIQHRVVCRRGRHEKELDGGKRNELEMAARGMNIKGNNNVGDGSQPRLATISMSGEVIF